MKPTPMATMNTRVKLKRVDIGEQGIEKVGTQATLLFLIEAESRFQIGSCRGLDDNLHRSPSRSLCFASDHGMKDSFPDSVS